MLPYCDNYFSEFHNLADMMSFHALQALESQWERTESKSLLIEPLDENSHLYADITAFAPGISEGAVIDTAKNLGLAIMYNGQFYPVRDTAYKCLTDRARISGNALSKLTKRDLADILNTCMGLYGDSALLLIRDQKVTAVHSGDDMDYTILHTEKLLEALTAKLDVRYPGSVFDSGYTDHSRVYASWSLPGQREELLETYQKMLIDQGKATLAGRLMPGIRFTTSDTASSSAKVSALLLGLQQPIQIGGIISVEHRRRTKVEDFSDALDLLFAQYKDAVTQLQNLNGIYLEYPVNAMTRVCKALRMPKKAALEAIKMFEVTYGGGASTAYEVFMGMQEIMFILKTSKTPESKMLALQETMARALTVNWLNYDLAKTVSW